jgi:hypothetical protein
MWRPLVLLAAAAVAVMLASCSDDDDGGPAVGTLRVTMVDAPTDAAEIEAIAVTFSKIEVHSSGEGDSSGWHEIVGAGLTEEQRTFDLLQLVNGNSAVIAQTSLGAGGYTQIRILVEKAMITVDGIMSNLTISSGSQTGIKLNHPFTIEAGQTTSLTLDFDAEQSVNETPPGSGIFRMSPVIRIVTTSEAGMIAGDVQPFGVDAVVEAYVAGTSTLVTTTQVDAASGDYMIQALAPGQYDIRVVASGYVTATASNVTVVSGEVSQGHDFTLVASGG